MRQGSGSRRSRGRANGKRSFNQGGGGPNRSFESNGPGVKLRGTAAQVFDKYLALARDATSSGDRIAAENFFQHAEHYYRLHSAFTAERRPQQTEHQRFDGHEHRPGDGEDGRDETDTNDPAAAAPQPQAAETAPPAADDEGEQGEQAEQKPAKSRRRRRNGAADDAEAETVA